MLYNIWDPGTAKIVAGAGAKALATGSHPVASAFGFPDGEKMPLELALENFRRIVAATDLPVTMDLESGYGIDTATVAASVSKAIAAGAVGFNFEDQIVGTANPVSYTHLDVYKRQDQQPRRQASDLEEDCEKRR